jgi:transcriptional regulator with XRE-family HTH domain
MTLESPAKTAVSAKRLLEARNTLGLTTEDVAEAIPLQEWELTAYEAGKLVPSDVEFRRLARLYRREVAWLMGEGEDVPVSPELLVATEALSTEDKEKVLAFARFLAAESAK